jgi:hypothetical protein
MHEGNAGCFRKQTLSHWVQYSSSVPKHVVQRYLLNKRESLAPVNQVISFVGSKNFNKDCHMKFHHNRPSLSRYPTLYYTRQVFYNNMKTSLFISLCILRDLPRELCGRGDLTIKCCSHGKSFWWDGSRKIQKHKARDRPGK